MKTKRNFSHSGNRKTKEQAYQKAIYRKANLKGTSKKV